jgi:hypothetical protein
MHHISATVALQNKGKKGKQFDMASPKGREREGERPTMPLIHVGGGPRVAATSPPLNLTIPNQDQGPTINQGP